MSHGTGENMPVIGIVEVKRKEEFNDEAICQTIGYHIVSRVVNARPGKPSSIIPPLLILACQDQLKFIYISFYHSYLIDIIVLMQLYHQALTSLKRIAAS